MLDVTAFTLDDMRRFAREAWGPFGDAVVDRWEEFNARYFGGELRPVPLVLSRTLPFGAMIGLCSYSPVGLGRAITLAVPKDHDRLVADNNTLLHEMIHQYLSERGEYAKHAGEGWRREIMRLHKLITGADIWAGRSKTVRRKEGDQSRVVRINEPHRTSGAVSLTQQQIARWPHEPAGTIALGSLGTEAVTQC